MIKTKTILFFRKKIPLKLNITCGNYSLIRHCNLEFLKCYIDSNLSGELMTSKVFTKINTKLNFLWRPSNYFSYSLKSLLSNAKMQPHFDYLCTSWYPLKYKLQIKLNYKLHEQISPSYIMKLN